MKSKNLSEKILKIVNSKGFNYIELDSIIEVDHIVQRSGENFRKFIFSFYDQNGSELCLRPDLTIASCLKYLEDNIKKKAKISYSGQAYRKSENKKDSIIRNQVGFEIIGSNNEKKDDKEIINTAFDLLSNSKFKNCKIKIGNIRLFNLLLNNLDIPKRWKLRLSRHFWREKYFDDLLKRLETNSDVDPISVILDKKKYRRMKLENKTKQIAGRSVIEILNRFDYKTKDPRKINMGRKISKIIKDFLKINCPINNASKVLNNFFMKNNINLTIPENYFPVNNKINNKFKIEFSTNFGRELEYYTGMVFAVQIRNKSKNVNLISGGRYDKLLSNLGSKRKISAVGAAINLNF